MWIIFSSDETAWTSVSQKAQLRRCCVLSDDSPDSPDLLSSARQSRPPPVSAARLTDESLSWVRPGPATQRSNWLVSLSLSLSLSPSSALLSVLPDHGLHWEAAVTPCSWYQQPPLWHSPTQWQLPLVPYLTEDLPFRNIHQQTVSFQFASL